MAIWSVVAAGAVGAGLILWRRSAAGEISRARANWTMAVVWSAGAALVAGPVVIHDAVMGEPVRGWVLGGLSLGALTTLVLLVRMVIGDPALGRRRCPKCWYDMGGTPGLVCPECGRGAKRASRLFRTRRSRWGIAASLLPLSAAAGVAGAWFVQEHGWVRLIPTPVLIASSPWLDWDDQMQQRLVNRLSWLEREPLPAWEAAMAKRISHRVVRESTNKQRVLMHAWILITLNDAVEETTTALLPLVDDPDLRVATSAVGMLGSMPPTDEVEEALTALTEHPQRPIQDRAVGSLGMIKRFRVGGDPPELLLSEAASVLASERPARACRALGLYAPNDRSRAVLTTAAGSSDAWVRGCAVGALANLYPEDERVHALVVGVLRDPAQADFLAGFVLDLAMFDQRLVERGEIPAARRGLYTDEVRAAIVNAAAGSEAAWLFWGKARDLLSEHPCFTESERERVRRRSKADAGRDPK